MNEESGDNGFLDRALIGRLGAIIRLWLDSFGTHHGFLKKDAAII
jgi:hypothetical protein